MRSIGRTEYFVINPNNCDIVGCKNELIKLQNTYTAFKFTDVTKCAYCLSTNTTIKSYYDANGNWSLPTNVGYVPNAYFSDLYQNKNILVLQPKKVRSWQYVETITIPETPVNTTTTYKLLLFRTYIPDTYQQYFIVPRDAPNYDNTKEYIFSTLESVRSDDSTGEFTVEPNTVVSNISLDLNTNTITAGSKTIMIPQSVLLYKTHKLDTTSLSPNYTIAIYRKPTYGWGTIGTNGVTAATGKIFENNITLYMSNYKYELSQDTTNNKKYVATFMNNASLPAGEYKFTLIYSNNTTNNLTTIVSISPTTSFSSYTLILSDLSSLTIGDLTVLINTIFLSNLSGTLTVKIEKITTVSSSASSTSVSSSPIFPMVPLSLPRFSYTSVTSGLNHTITFNNGFKVSSTTNGQVLKLTLDNATDTTDNYIDVNGVKLTLNDASGYVLYNYYKTDNAPTGIKKQFPMHYLYNTERTVPVSLSLGDRTFVSDTITIPPTELKIDITDSTSIEKSVTGKFMMNSGNPVVLPVGKYVISVRSSIMTRVGSASGSTAETVTQTLEHTSNTEIAFTVPLHSYAIDTVGQTILFYGKDAPTTVIQSVPLINDFNRTLSQEARSIQVDVSGVGTTIGPFKTRYKELGGIYLIGTTSTTNAGYIISGNIMQDKNAVPLTNLNYKIAFNDNTITLFELSSNELNGATRYELNITSDTISFFVGANTIALKSFEFKSLNSRRFIEYLSPSKNTSLDIVLNGTIKLDKTITIPAPKFTITQQATNPEVYEYELPEPYVLITTPVKEYELTLTADLGSGTAGTKYGIMKFKPTAPTRKFTINVNTGEVAFISTGGATINRFDVQGLRESGLTGQTDKDFLVKLKMNGVDFPLDPTSATATIKSTKFNPATANAGVYSGSDESTNIRVDLGAKSGSLSGSALPGSSITPVSQLEPNTNYTITVNRTGTSKDGPLLQAEFKSGVTTESIAAVNYNRDANTIMFLTAAGAAVGDALVSSLPVAPDLRRMNGEKINIEITQLVNYTGTANSASDGTVVTASAAPTKKTIFKQTNETPLGTQVVETSWDKGEVIFTLRNPLFNKTVQLPPGDDYILKINTTEIPIKVEAPVRVSRMRLNVFTGKLVAITHTGASITVMENTGILATTTKQLISASISLGSSPLYETSTDPTRKATIPAVYESCNSVKPATEDVFLLLGGDGKGFTRTEAASKSISALQFAKLTDVKAAAKAGANWDTPGWILGDIDNPPVYPINEYSEIQIFAAPHRNYFAADKAPGPIPTGPYVISYLPVAADGEEPRAGILVKGDRTTVPSGFTVVKFNTYTGQTSLGSVAPSNEIFHISLPANTSWADARAACQKFGGDIAIETTVGAEGLNVPIGAQWTMYGFMYKLFVNNDVSNLVRVGHPKQPTTGVFVLEGTYTTTSTANGVICYGSKKTIDRTKNEVKFDASGNVSGGTVSDYNYDRHIWSKYESISPILYNSYMPKNIEAIIEESDAYYKAAMIINDGRTQPNIVFARSLQDAELYAGCDVRNMTCTAISSDDVNIEPKYVAPTSSTGKWTNVDLDELRLEKSGEGFQGQSLPSHGMQRMMSDMELFGRTPVELEGLVGDVTGPPTEEDDTPRVLVRESFVSGNVGVDDETRKAGKVGVDDETRKAVNEILDCQMLGGAVNITQDSGVYPGCNTICCFPDDGRQLDPSLIKNRRKTSGPGAATCDDEGGCTETTSKAPIRHTPLPAPYSLKKKTALPTPPAPKCASATPLRTQMANAKRDKLETLRNKPVN